MAIKQISIFLENKPGMLKSMCQVLADNNIDMRALSLVETKDFGIARIIVDNVIDTANVLKDAGFVHSVSSVLAVAIPDVPGGLSQVLSVLAAENTNIEYMYAFLGARAGSAYMIFKVAGHHKAAAALGAAGIRLVDQDELSEL